MKKNRYEYFRMRSMIGKLEKIAVDKLVSLGHEPEPIRDDDEAVGFFCITCEYFGCAEFPEGKSGRHDMHGPIFEHRCGAVPQRVVDYDMAWDRAEDIFGGLDAEGTV